MNRIGGQEVLMPALHPSQNWKTTGAWDNVDVLFKLNSRTGKEYALGQSHEEIVTPLAKEAIKSYKDLPLALYQIQWKFRDELRAKSGILRGREFEMKDMYSFHETQADFDRFYQIVKQAYLDAYAEIGLVAKATEASGGSFSKKISYEFMVLTSAGEDDIYYCDACDFCVNKEIAQQTEKDMCPHCGKEQLKLARASEVGNIFDLGKKYSDDFDLTFTDKTGQQQKPIMGCYGWGTTRIMGVLVEQFNDDKGIAWPARVSPAAVHLISLRGGEEQAKNLYESLQAQGISTLWDDRDVSPGTKFADADLIGIPVRAVISTKTNGQIEFKLRSAEKTELLSESEFVARIKAIPKLLD